jgi:glycerophosphoryl diester phosphodiesterase
MSAPPNPFLAEKRHPIVVGHRGVPTLHQENSLAGFRRAAALGIPAVELDARLTRDGRAVVCHDDDVERLTGVRARISDLTWDEVAKLRLRRAVPMGVDARGAAVVARYEREEPIPQLAEVLHEVGHDLLFNIELKLDLERWWPIDVGGVVAREIRHARVEERAIVTSFDPRKLRAAGRAYGRIAWGFCFDDSMLDFARRWVDPQRALNRLLDLDFVGRVLGTRLVGAEHTLVGAQTVQRLHARGVAVGTHTLFPLGSTTGKPIAPAAATEAEVDRLVALGVDWIESDDPARLLAHVSRHG